MSIETYTTKISDLYLVLFFLCIVIGIVEIWNRIRKKPLKYWGGIIPCSILYLISAIFSTFVASMAYDDPADPNYAHYKNWELHDFILHDIKTFIIWLSIGILIYLVLGRKSTKKSRKLGCAVLSGFLILLGVVLLLSMVKPL